MPITTLPAAPSRSDPTTFASKGDALLGALATFVTEANALETTVNAAEVVVVAAEAVAVAAKNTAQAAANYKGPWADQTGAAAVPYAVSHIGKYWQLASNLADVTAKTPGTDSEWIVISGYYARVNLTDMESPVSMTVGDCDGFKTYTNTTSVADIVFNLPPGADGLKVNVMVTESNYMKFVANGTEKFRYHTLQSAAGGYIRSNVIGVCFTIEWSGTEWIVTSLNGPIKYDE